mgnify:CR=1 FL=1
MRPTSVTVSGTGTSSVVVPDYNISPFNVGVGCKISATATYTVEHTYDDPNNLPAGVSFPFAFNHPRIIEGDW